MYTLYDSHTHLIWCFRNTSTDNNKCPQC